MATRTVKARVELDGEKEYKNALSELNKGNQVLASEMRKLQAQFKGNEDSTEALTAKGELLERQLLQQKDKVQTLREALQRAAAEYGEADARTQEWTIKLNNAEAAQFDLERSIQENNDALEHQGQEMVGLGDGIDELTGKLGIHLPDAAKEALNGMGEFSAGSVAQLGLVAAAITAAIEGLKKLQQITLESAAKVDDVLTESAITGLSAETIQGWTYAAEFVDVSAGTMTGALSKLTRSMDSARDGNQKTASAFAQLGVAIYDQNGELRRSEDVFYDAIDALGQIGNVTERDALTMDLMGKSAQELNPLIQQGSKALKDYAAEAEAMGYILSEDELSALAAVDDEYQRMTKTIEAAKDELAVEFAPASQSAMELFGTAVQTGSDILEKSGLLENLALILSSLGEIGKDILDLIGSIPGLDQALGALKVTLGAVAQLVAVIADAADLVTGLLTLDFKKAGNALGFGYSSGQANNYQRVYMTQNGTWQDYQDFYNSPYYTGYAGNNASGNENWRGGLTWLGEGGPETAILPRGTRIYSAQDTESLGAGDVYNFTVDVRQLEDLDGLIRWAKSQRVRGRMK